MKSTVRIFVACAIGAFIGSVLALQMYQIFWWVGALVGALTGYIVYDFEEVLAAIPIAWANVTSWRPNRRYWSLWRTAFVGEFHFGVNLVVGAGIIIAVVYWLIGDRSVENDLLVLKFEGALMLTASVALGLLMGLVTAPGTVSRFMSDHDGELEPPAWWHTPNAFRFYLWLLPRWIVMSAWWLTSRVPQIVLAALYLVVVVTKYGKDFSIELFRLVHSELRLLCAVDAAFGTAAGYFSGNALIGALVGGVLGVVNYEIVTVRVMKLEGAKSLFK